MFKRQYPLLRHWVKPIFAWRYLDGWPPRSQDLTTCEFRYFSPGLYLKSEVYRPHPQNLRSPHRNDNLKVEVITLDMTRRKMNNYKDRLNQCLITEVAG